MKTIYFDTDHLCKRLLITATAIVASIACVLSSTAATISSKDRSSSAINHSSTLTEGPSFRYLETSNRLEGDDVIRPVVHRPAEDLARQLSAKRILNVVGGDVGESSQNGFIVFFRSQRDSLGIASIDSDGDVSSKNILFSPETRLGDTRLVDRYYDMSKRESVSFSFPILAFGVEDARWRVSYAYAFERGIVAYHAEDKRSEQTKQSDGHQSLGRVQSQKIKSILEVHSEGRIPDFSTGADYSDEKTILNSSSDEISLSLEYSREDDSATTSWYVGRISFKVSGVNQQIHGNSGGCERDSRLKDFNLDGIKDIEVCSNRFVSGERSSKYYIYEPQLGVFVHRPSFNVRIGTLTVNKDESRLEHHWRSGVARHGTKMYTVVDGDLKIVRSVVVDDSKETREVYERVDGEMKLVSEPENPDRPDVKEGTTEDRVEGFIQDSLIDLFGKPLRVVRRNRGPFDECRKDGGLSICKYTTDEGWDHLGIAEESVVSVGSARVYTKSDPAWDLYQKTYERIEANLGAPVFDEQSAEDGSLNSVWKVEGDIHLVLRSGRNNKSGEYTTEWYVLRTN